MLNKDGKYPECWGLESLAETLEDARVFIVYATTSHCKGMHLDLWMCGVGGKVWESGGGGDIWLAFIQRAGLPFLWRARLSLRQPVQGFLTLATLGESWGGLTQKCLSCWLRNNRCSFPTQFASHLHIALPKICMLLLLRQKPWVSWSVSPFSLP